MELALVAPIQYQLNQVAAVLRNEGASPIVTTFGAPVQLASQRVGLVVLISPEQAPTLVGHEVTLARKAIGDDRCIILCTPDPSLSDRKLLLGCGASKIISPRSWSPGHVAERILGEVILAGGLQPSSFGVIKGSTSTLRNVYDQIKILAPLDDPILILGETGTGKELVAGELHRESGRAGKYLPINCAAISRDLLQSELFGHEKGAFTNAIQARKGLLAEAGNGTVFLDEIGDLDPEAQAKLLRVIEERRVMPVGSNKWQAIHARMVMATNRELDQEVAEGRFRQDLFMRLSGFTISVPPLRERRADLPLLVDHFVDEYNREQNLALTVPEGALDCLFLYDWPGNVRELRSAVRKAAAFANRAAGVISAPMLQEATRPRGSRLIRHMVPFDPAVDTWQDVIQRAQRLYFHAILALTGGNKDAAAKRAGIGRTQLYEKLKAIDKRGA
jgi:two-component system response regulator HydG